MSRSALGGHATPAGTRRGADSFGAGARGLGRTGLTVSPVGFGAYRVRDDAALHRRALADALRAGVNLIDTSANYGGGSSEVMIGRMLANLVQNGELRREQVVVVSKLGYAQGETLERLRVADPAQQEVVQVDPHHWHCIHPTFLREQLQHSLGRLGLERLDVLLLHNPEYAMATEDPDGEAVFDDRLRRAFAELETQVAQGRISAYGVSSNGFSEEVGQPRATSLRRMLELAAEVGGPQHHFGVAQMPLNLFELGALRRRGQEPSSLEIAARQDVGVLTNRPLNAFVRRGETSSLLRLADVPSSGASLDEARRLLAGVRKLEAQWATGLGRQLMVGPEENAVDLFRWGQELGPRLDDLSLEQWTHLRHEIIATHLGRTSGALLESLQGETRQAFAQWWERYGTLLHEAFAAIEAGLRSRRHDRAGQIVQALDPCLPMPWRSLPLSNKAVLTALSAPVSSVLVGMRQPGYVRDVLRLREHPVRLLGASAGPLDFDAVGTAMAATGL